MDCRAAGATYDALSELDPASASEPLPDIFGLEVLKMFRGLEMIVSMVKKSRRGLYEPAGSRIPFHLDLEHATSGRERLDSHTDLVTIAICVRDVSAAGPVIATDPCLPRSRKARGAPRMDEAHSMSSPTNRTE